MEDLAFMAQAAAMLRRAEYTALLIKWFDDSLVEGAEIWDKEKPWHLRSEFPLAQTMVAIAQLSAGDPRLMEIV